MDYLLEYSESDSDEEETAEHPKVDSRGVEKNVNKPTLTVEPQAETEMAGARESSLEGCKQVEREGSDESGVTDYLGLNNENSDSDCDDSNFMRGDRIWSKPIPSQTQNKVKISETKKQSSEESERTKIEDVTHAGSLGSNKSLPLSSFWQRGKEDDWKNPDKIWAGPSNFKAPRSINAMSGSQTHDETYGYSKRSRTQSKADMFKSEEKSIDTVTKSTALEKNCFFVHHKVSPFLHQTSTYQPPRKLLVQLEGHAGAVNRIKWCKPEYSHLLASVSMDRSVKVWNVFSTVKSSVQTLSFHTKAIRDLCWSPSGTEILSCGYDKVAYLQNVLKGSLVQKYEHHDFLTCIKYHPVNPNYILAGSRDKVLCWDVRSNECPMKVFHHKNNYGLVQDLIFLRDGSEFAISTEAVSRDAADRSIIVYDFCSGVVLSNQVYQERYTCPRLCEHPQQSEMMAQTNGDYMALFSTIRPYKMNKCKRYDKHKVLGYAVGCGYSPDGRYVVSGGSNGKVTIYDYQRAVVLQSLGETEEIYLDVAWHPVLKSTIASSTWSGKITIWN